MNFYSPPPAAPTPFNKPSSSMQLYLYKEGGAALAVKQQALAVKLTQRQGGNENGTKPPVPSQPCVTPCEQESKSPSVIHQPPSGPPLSWLLQHEQWDSLDCSSPLASRYAPNRCTMLWFGITKSVNTARKFILLATIGTKARRCRRRRYKAALVELKVILHRKNPKLYATLEGCAAPCW